MVRVKYLVCMAGDRFVRNAGDPGEVEEAEAARLFAAGYAEPAAEPDTGDELAEGGGRRKKKRADK